MEFANEIFPIICLAFGLGFITGIFIAANKYKSNSNFLDALNWLTALLGLLTTAIAAIPATEPNKKRGEKLKFILLIVVGVGTMICAVWNGQNQKTKDNQNEIQKGKLNDKISNIQTSLNAKIKSDLIFENWLKDTFGITRINDKPIIYNTNIFYLKAKDLLESINDDSSNIIVERISKDSIVFYPKTGIWVKPIVGFEAKFNSDKTNVPYGVEDYGASPETIKLYGNKLKFVLWSIYTTPTINNKFRLNIDSFRNQTIIFGDESNLNKLYAYYNGKITWIPQK